jgi:hypothetical protein
MKRVEVDFSTTVRRGMIRASQRRALQTLNQGDRVEAFDPDEGISFIGVVNQVDDDGRFAYLRMEWEDNRLVPRNEPGLNLFVASLSTATVQSVQETSSEKGEGAFVSALQVGAPQPWALSLPRLTPA